MHNFTKKVLVFAALCALSVGSAFGQIGFQEGKIYLGPTVGYGFGGIGFGLGGEYAIDKNFGVGLEFAYTGFSEDAGFLKANYTLIGALAGASYHFSPKKKFDPFVKVGLGYLNWDVSFTDAQGNTVDPFAGFGAAYASGMGITGQVGARYHLSSSTSIRAALGYPFLFSAGFDFAFGDAVGQSSTTPEDKDVEKPDTSKASTSSTSSNRYGMYLGAFVGGKGAFNVNIPDGRKGGPGFAPEFGAMVYLPFGKKSPVGVSFEIGANSYSFINKPNKDATDDNTITEKYNYFTFAPSLNLAGFKLGVLFGFPTSASALNGAGTSMAGATAYDSASYAQYLIERITNPDAVYDPDLSEFLGTLVEARIGGMIPLLDDDTGRLDLHLQAGYVLTGLYDDYTTYNYTQLYDENGQPKRDNKNKLVKDSGLNPQPVTFSIGLSYAFKIPFGK